MYINHEGVIYCPHHLCESANLHPIDVTCITQNDGMGPYHGQRVYHKGNKTYTVEVKAPWLDFDQKNTTRELDSFLTFYCELCNRVSGIGLTFHKGLVSFEHKAFDIEYQDHFSGNPTLPILTRLAAVKIFPQEDVPK